MKLKKKPVVIEGVQFLGFKHTEEWPFSHILLSEQNVPWIQQAFDDNILIDNGTTLSIKTLEGDLLVSKGDWILRGVQGELYPCKPSIKEETYNEVHTEED